MYGFYVGWLTKKYHTKNSEIPLTFFSERLIRCRFECTLREPDLEPARAVHGHDHLRTRGLRPRANTGKLQAQRHNSLYGLGPYGSSVSSTGSMQATGNWLMRAG